MLKTCDNTSNYRIEVAVRLSAFRDFLYFVDKLSIMKGNVSKEEPY